MSIDHSDEVGWPAQSTPVHQEPGYQGNCWRSSRWRENEQGRRRRRYRAWRAAGLPWREARRLAHLSDRRATP